mmetsp:Transcript_76689/g.220084  ORF Transcript_76689/g.220084 Transcript_76689/m.220084 type:complete len:216 (+) Transcript_76689:2030-2677(+)
MVVDRRVTRGAGERLADPMRDVRQRVGVAVAFGKAEVDAKAQLRRVRAHDEVSRFDIAVDEVAPVHGVHALQQLVRQLQGRLQREPSAALGKEVFERGSEDVHDHNVRRAVSAVVVHPANTRASLKFTVHLCSGAASRVERWVKPGSSQVKSSRVEPCQVGVIEESRAEGCGSSSGFHVERPAPAPMPRPPLRVTIDHPRSLVPPVYQLRSSCMR